MQERGQNIFLGIHKTQPPWFEFRMHIQFLHAFTDHKKNSINFLKKFKFIFKFEEWC